MGNPAGLLLVAFGLLGAVWPYKVTRFGEQMDAIGSKRSLSDVEPADWNVMLTRIVGGVCILFGLGVTFGG
jgi:hypothetical protein